jgi:hypothetical protein
MLSYIVTMRAVHYPSTIKGPCTSKLLISSEPSLFPRSSVRSFNGLFWCANKTGTQERKYQISGAHAFAINQPLNGHPHIRRSSTRRDHAFLGVCLALLSMRSITAASPKNFGSQFGAMLRRTCRLLVYQISQFMLRIASFTKLCGLLRVVK